MGMENVTESGVNPDRVLAKATRTVAKRLALRPRVICRILGISPQEWKRVKAGTRGLPGQTPVGRRALQLIEIYLGLLGILGTDAHVRRWLRARVTPLEGTPLALMQRRRGFEDVVRYVSDAVSRQPKTVRYQEKSMPRKTAPLNGKTPAPDRAPSNAGSPANPTPGIDALAAQIGAMVPASLDDIVRANHHLLRITLATPEQIAEKAAPVPRGPGRHTLSGWYVIGFETAADRALFLLGRTETGQTWLTSPVRAIDLGTGMVETGNSMYVLERERRGVGEPDAELLILICVSLCKQGLGTVLGIAEWSY